MTMTKKTRLAGLVLSVVALIYYLFNTASYAFPNEWSAALASIVGMDPFRPLSRPIWQGIMYVFGMLPGSGVLVAANYLNALLGSVAVWLAFLTGYRLLVHPVYARSDAEKQQISKARIVSALVTAGFVAVCMPVVVLATRAHPLMFDLCLILSVILLTLQYRDEHQLRQWYTFAILYGIGISEFTSFIILAPLFAVAWAWLFWKNKKIAWKPIAIGLLLIAIGTSISFIFCWFYAKSAIAEWREFDSFWEVYNHFIMDQFNQLRFSVPKQGWLIVLLTMILPVVFVIKSDYFGDHDIFTKISLYFFRLILVAVAVVVLLNLPGSAWYIIGPGVLLITPYLIAALWVGQLAGFLYHAAGNPVVGRLQRRKKVNPIPRYAVVAVCSFLFVAAGVLNMVEATPRRGAPLAELSRDILERSSGHSFLISNGILDTMMQWQAYEKGQSLHIINSAQVSSMAYRHFINTWFDDPALESISVIGFTPFLDLWMSSDSNIVENLIILGQPATWSIQGFSWSPYMGMYKGKDISESTSISAEQVQRNLAFLEKHLAAFGDDAEWPEILERYRTAVTSYLSIFANNLGFRLASLGKWDEAERSYAAALGFNDGNLSAMINLGEIAKRNGEEERIKELEDRYNTIVIMMPTRVTPRLLVQQFGYVRDYSIFMREGLALVEAGMGQRGLDVIQQSMEMGGEDFNADAAIARALFEEGKFDESLEIYNQLIEQDAGNTEAWIGIARCYLLTGKIEDAENVFSRLQDMGVPPGQLAMERGFLSLRTKKPQEALVYFRQGVLDEASKGAAAVGMIWAGLAVKDSDAVLKAEAILEELPRYFVGQMMLYELAMSRQNAEAAYEYISRALNIQPGNVDVLEKIIRIELLEGRELEAKKWLDRLLAIDSSNAYGNYLLSGILEQEGRLDLAENALRRALLQGPRGDVLYGLAWILEKQERHEEAIDAIDQALGINGQNPQYLAVKGIILSGMNKWQEAESRLQEAIRLRGDEEIPLFELYLARIYTHTGRQEEANSILAKYETQREKLGEDEVKVMDSLK